ncbi:hypothetical protein D1007_47549 [Hordeum vulgare]|nr:hypothetical protein D1007_47549 [Hordeum vulgare]
MLYFARMRCCTPGTAAGSLQLGLLACLLDALLDLGFGAAMLLEGVPQLDHTQLRLLPPVMLQDLLVRHPHPGGVVVVAVE